MPDNNPNLDSCLKCYDCNTACPVTTVYPSYPGPKFLGPELERLRKEGICCDTVWVDYCMGCGRCDLVCPNQVKICEMIGAAKAQHKKKGVRGLRDRMFARPRLLAKSASIAPRWVENILGWRPIRSLMSRYLHVHHQRTLPAYASRHLQAPIEHAEGKPRLLYFPGCFVEFNAPEVGRATIDVLQRNGFAVKLGSFRCCGLPALANGDRQEILRNARHNVLEMKSAVAEGTQVVSGCPSCSLMLKATYPQLFPASDPLHALAQDVSHVTYDLGEFLSALARDGKLDLPTETKPQTLAYHSACHLKAQGIGTPWVDVLSQISGLAVLQLDCGCCGMAGTYGFKKEKYAISMDIAKNLFTALQDLHADAAITECAMCQHQIRHVTRAKTLHPVMVLSQAYNSSNRNRGIAK